MISQLSGGGRSSSPLMKCSTSENEPSGVLRNESAHSAMLPRYVVDVSLSRYCTLRIVRGSRYCCAISATLWWPRVPQAAAVEAEAATVAARTCEDFMAGFGEGGRDGGMQFGEVVGLMYSLRGLNRRAPARWLVAAACPMRSCRTELASRTCLKRLDFVVIAVRS